MIFLHFDMASESTGEQLVLCLKWKESVILKLKCFYRFTHALYFLFGGMFIGDEGKVKSGAGLKTC